MNFRTSYYEMKIISVKIFHSLDAKFLHKFGTTALVLIYSIFDLKLLYNFGYLLDMLK